MEKYFEEWNGKQYPCRVLDLSIVEEGYGKGNVTDYELWCAIEDDCDNDNSDAIGLDREIFFYCDSGFIASNPTDAEIILELLIKCKYSDYSEISDDDWYNLMRIATDEIRQWYAEGKTNVNCESYECGAVYSVYAYTDGVNRELYSGKSPAMAAMAAIAFGSALKISQKVYL